jgi:hypothetical protein
VSLNNGQERIDKFGEAFTPDSITNRMLDMLDPKAWAPDKTFLDPSSGDGNMLTCFLRRKLAQGHDPIQALSTIYGADIQLDNIQESHRRLTEMVLEKIPKELHYLVLPEINRILQHNVFLVKDSLTFDWDSLQPLETHDNYVLKMYLAINGTISAI